MEIVMACCCWASCCCACALRVHSAYACITNCATAHVCRDPLVLPFFHSNMGSVLPIATPLLPRVGHTVTVTVGEPMDLSDVTCRCHTAEDPQQVWKDITLRIHDTMKQLELQSPRNPYQCPNPKGKPRTESVGDSTADTSSGDARLAERA
eukprot:360578-Chlamydomonas_euryale.AAC.19